MAADGEGRAASIEIVDLSRSSPPPEAGPSKRKAESSNGAAAEKKARTDSPVELKGRKLVFRQTPYQRTVPRRRLLNFEALLLDAEDEGTKLDAIPDEFYDVVVLAGHELTSSSETLFLKHLKAELVKGSPDLLPNDILQPLVSKLFTQKNYGFLPSDFGSSSSKFPAGLQIRCWEATDLDKYFPADKVPDLIERRTERENARKACEAILEGLDDIERQELFKGDKATKDTTKEADVVAIPSPVKGMPSPLKDRGRQSREGTAATDSSRRSASPTKKSKMTPEELETAQKKKEEREAKKVEREEKKKEQEEKRKEREAQREAKRLELEEKKAAKEREEEEKAAVKAKQAQKFGAFFKKPAAASSPVKAGAVQAGPSKAAESEESDFQRVFKPPVQRANVDWAPVNRWAAGSEAKHLNEENVAGWSPRDFLDDHLKRHKLSGRTPRTHVPTGLKTAPTHGTVAEVWATYQDSADPRSILDQLRDVEKYPWKTLAFDQQVRPPYSGTFTKRSVVVGPRTPFAQDPIFDYSYDSGDEWQDDEGGDDVDDFGEAEPDDGDVEDQEEDGEFDDWLDNSDDIVFEDDGDVAMTTSPNRLDFKPVKKAKVVPKRVTKLTPFWRGPVWEETIAEPVEGMDTYRIQLLNDTPDSIDPFTYESSDPTQFFKTNVSDTFIGMQRGVPCLLAAESVSAKVAAAAAAPVVKPAKKTAPKKPRAPKADNNKASDAKKATPKAATKKAGKIVKTIKFPTTAPLSVTEPNK